MGQPVVTAAAAARAFGAAPRREPFSDRPANCAPHPPPPKPPPPPKKINWGQPVSTPGAVVTTVATSRLRWDMHHDFSLALSQLSYGPAMIGKMVRDKRYKIIVAQRPVHGCAPQRDIAVVAATCVPREHSLAHARAYVPHAHAAVEAAAGKLAAGQRHERKGAARVPHHQRCGDAARRRVADAG